ncbi:carboxymuconolactone decarboxylase family protein [Saccharothrix syringae]|uniref:Carboxymuconolactone decarboxylase family protein n=1 Tax=Saccharothrix syringae TaxID=103733 RepID=A0A5Q0H108_SACSY|nr:carboxymuconolactone decarboxylase family protein [Saccharothrix syringae]QFZ19927.1 carboxymuconolactone decarboxylase family protein [Saccharothrix syringae]
MSTHQPRLPDPTAHVPRLTELGGLLFEAVGNGSVPRTTISLVHLRAGQLVGNTYLTARHTGDLRRGGETEDRISAVASWRDAPCFTGPERAALALVEAVLTPNPHGERVPDELYAQVSRHYDDLAITTLALAIGQVNFFVPLVLVGRPLPGATPAEQWRR